MTIKTNPKKTLIEIKTDMKESEGERATVKLKMPNLRKQNKRSPDIIRGGD